MQAGPRIACSALRCFYTGDEFKARDVLGCVPGVNLSSASQGFCFSARDTANKGKRLGFTRYKRAKWALVDVAVA